MASAQSPEKNENPVVPSVYRPQITLQGNRLVIVEGHQKILRYQCDELVLDCNKLRVSIQGDALCITSFCRESMVIAGQIRCVRYLTEGQYD